MEEKEVKKSKARDNNKRNEFNKSSFGLNRLTLIMCCIHKY